MRSRPAACLFLLLLAASCSTVLEYGDVTFNEGLGGGGLDASQPDVTQGGAGAGGAAGADGGLAGAAGAAGGSAGSAGEAGAANTGGTSAGGNGGSGGDPAVCGNTVCEPGEDCSGCASDCACAAGSECVFASPPGQWTCVCNDHAFCAPGKCQADRCRCDLGDGGTQACEPGQPCAPAGGCAP